MSLVLRSGKGSLLHICMLLNRAFSNSLQKIPACFNPILCCQIFFFYLIVYKGTRPPLATKEAGKISFCKGQQSCYSHSTPPLPTALSGKQIPCYVNKEKRKRDKVSLPRQQLSMSQQEIDLLVCPLIQTYPPPKKKSLKETQK